MIEMIYKGEKQDGQEVIVLPKNVRQVGEVQKDRKVYIEDYVVTYMKQKITENKNLGCILVLMGRKEYTPDTMYMFVDGAFAVDYRETGPDYIFGDKIWEEVYETIKKYFISSEMVGWVIYDDDLSEDKLLKAQHKNFPAEDMLLLKQESYEDDSMYYLYREGCLQPLHGFFVYYEKNEVMQEFMVEHMRTASAQEEKWIRQKEAPVVRYRSRMKDRRQHTENNRANTFLYAVSSVLVLLIILVGISMVNNYEKLLDMRASLENMVSVDEESASEELPRDQEKADTVIDQAAVEMVPAGVEKLPEDKTEENADIPEPTEPLEETEPQEEVISQEEQHIPKEQEEESVEASATTGVYYTIELGETLMGISKKVYGTEGMVDKLCEVNGISDGDKIQAGQKILLP